MKLTRDDVFVYSMIGCAIACFVCFVTIAIVLLLSLFGICEPIDMITVHSITLLAIQFMILCLMHDVKVRDKYVWERLNLMRKQFEALGLTSTTKSKESPFPKDSDQCTSSRSKDSSGEVAQ